MVNDIRHATQALELAKAEKTGRGKRRDEIPAPGGQNQDNQESSDLLDDRGLTGSKSGFGLGRPPLPGGGGEAKRTAPDPRRSRLHAAGSSVGRGGDSEAGPSRLPAAGSHNTQEGEDNDEEPIDVEDEKAMAALIKGKQWVIGGKGGEGRHAAARGVVHQKARGRGSREQVSTEACVLSFS